jgi:chromosome segregation ATPase
VYTARLVSTLAFLGAVVNCGTVFAQVERSGGGANAQLMQQFQQAVSERTQLQAENAKLKKDAEDVKKQLATAQQQLTASKAGSDRNQAAVAAARASNESTQKTLEETKSKMQELVARFRETVTTMRGIETERAQLRQQLAASQSAYDQCAESNNSLYQIDNEVLDRYQHQGAFSYFERSEPFTRLKRTQIDNLALEYRQRAEELRIKRAGVGSGANKPNSGTPAASNAGGPPPTPNSSGSPPK